MSRDEELLSAAARRLAQAGIDTAQFDARHLLAHVLGIAFSEVGRFANPILTPEQAGRFEALLKRRAAREPLQRLLGSWGFWSLDLEMGEDGLVPRPDSESLIDALLELRPDRNRELAILDLGTGTGCLLLAALSEYPKANGLGVDIAPGAVALAERNAKRNGMGGRARFRLGDWGAGLDADFDVVLSNPPYIPSGDIPKLAPEVARFDPSRALDGGPDGYAAYRRIADQLPGLLKPGGLAVLEVGQGQAGPVAELLRSAGLDPAGARTDLGGIVRAVLAEKPR